MADPHGFFVHSVSDSMYEYAGISCMQAVSVLSVNLSLALNAVHARNMTDCSSCLLQAARMADFLKEEDMHDSISTLHRQVFVHSDDTVNLSILFNACKGLEIKWRETLRQNATRYVPSGMVA